MNPKKIAALLLVIAMVFALFGCAKEEIPAPTGDTSPAVSDDPIMDVTKPDETEPTTEPTGTDATDPIDSTDSTDPTDATDPTESADPTDPTDATDPSDPTDPTKPAEVKPTKITASVKGSYEVGDTLKSSDFTVKVTMSDGTVLTNPSDWTASTMKLTSTSNKITVTYKGVSATVTVKATLGAINGMDLVGESFKYIGLKYVDGGNSLTNGTDCSGFTKLIFAKYGIELPRTPSAQNKVGKIISAEEAKPGDLLVETYPEENKYDGHSGIYIGGGKMISAMPNSGVVIETVHSGMDYIRVYDNSYMGTDEDAYFDCVETLLSLGHIGRIYNVHVDWPAGKAYIGGYDPMGKYVNLNINDPKPGYESFLAVLKTMYLAHGRAVQINPSGGNCTDTDYYGYVNGSWYTRGQLREMVESGEIESYSYSFFGAFWNSNATIITSDGETVDLSTCSELTNYSTIAQPGNPNEGKDYLAEYDFDKMFACKDHFWLTENKNTETGTFDNVCRYCDECVQDCEEIKNHTHQIYVEFWEADYYDESYYEHYCLTCGYSEKYPVKRGEEVKHPHDYSYEVYTYEPTCCTDGFTIHTCKCGASYKDNIVKCAGHDYGKTTTVAPTADANGYDIKECKECGHKNKDNYVEAP